MYSTKFDWKKAREAVKNNPNKKWLWRFNVGTIDDKTEVVRECTQLKPYRLFVLFHLTRLCEDLKIPYYISDGTLLGWYRNKGILSHDMDCDLTVLSEDLTKIWNYRKKLPKEIILEFQLSTDIKTLPKMSDVETMRKNKHSHKRIYKIVAYYDSRLLPDPSFDNTFFWQIKVDIQTIRKSGNGYSYNYFADDPSYGMAILPSEWFFPLKRGRFEFMEVNIPANSKKLLEHTYGYIGKMPTGMRKVVNIRSVNSYVLQNLFGLP